MGIGFASDNSATIHPDVLASIARANVGHVPSYGHDDYCHAVAGRVLTAFAAPAGAAAYFVFNGTGANVLSIRACCRPWEAVLCSSCAHLNTDEVGAPEAIAGAKLLTLPAPQGKVSVDDVERLLAVEVDEHSVEPKLLSLTQSTECGTIYSPDELRSLCEVAHRAGLLVHLDGSRLANAAAGLDCSLAAISTEVGADIVSFGGTKNGLMVGEVVVVLNPVLTEGMLFLRKQTLQLASKARFIAAQFDALMEGELWRANAAHANAMAARLATGVAGLPGVSVVHPVQANVVFAALPAGVADRLRSEFDFYDWDAARGEVRWMCAWDTAAEDVDRFIAAIRDAVG